MKQIQRDYAAPVQRGVAEFVENSVKAREIQRVRVALQSWVKGDALIEQTITILKPHFSALLRTLRDLS